MIRNYLQTAVRNFYKNKLHTIISVAGLTLGITCVFLITLYLRQELSYDRFHYLPENLYRITWEDENPQTRTPHPMAQALAADFPEVESAVSLTPLFASGMTLEEHSFRNLERDERFDEARILAVDTTFFDVFSFPVLRGDPDKALKQVNGILISESMARKYFADADPIGKQLAVDSDSMLIEVVAVFKDVPVTSHFQFDFLISYVREKSLEGDDPFYSWSDFGHYNYIRLKPGSDPKALESKLLDWLKKYFPISSESVERLKAAGFGFRVQPVTSIHLNSHLRWELGVNGNMESIYILGAAALLILIIASLNFMNLTAAKSTERAKEIGVRKSLGAGRGQLVSQFIGESIMISMVAVVLAVGLIQLSIPWFNQVTGSSVSAEFLEYFPMLTALGVLIGFVSALYPSMYLSAPKPSAIIKGDAAGASPGLFRDVMIAFQFGMSMALISGAFVIYNQLEFLQHRSLGFNSENVMVIPVKSDEVSARFTELKTELERVDGIHLVSASSNIPGRQYNQNPITAAEFPDDDLATSECMVHPDYFNTMEINLKDGRMFSSAVVADSMNAYILNETAVNQLGLANPIGAEIDWHRDEGNAQRGRVIGVVEDFHFQSLHEPIRPILFVMDDEYNFIVIRGTFSDLESQITALKNVYRKFDPIFQFDFTFLDDQLMKQYEGEKRLGGVIAIFSVIAIAIACAGLFGMALLLFNRKIKEISIRKVLGASNISLVLGLLKAFTLLVTISGLAAAPITWWVMERWLSNFNYRIDVNVGVFIVSAALLLAISWATLSFLTVKTTNLNPADTLKSE